MLTILYGVSLHAPVTHVFLPSLVTVSSYRGATHRSILHIPTPTPTHATSSHVEGFDGITGFVKPACSSIWPRQESNTATSAYLVLHYSASPWQPSLCLLCNNSQNEGGKFNIYFLFQTSMSNVTKVGFLAFLTTLCYVHTLLADKWKMTDDYGLWNEKDMGGIGRGLFYDMSRHLQPRKYFDTDK